MELRQISESGIYNIYKKKKGSAVAYALSVIFMVALIILSIVQYIVGQARGSFHEANDQQAFRVAEAGANFYRWYLAHETDGKSAQQIQDFWGSTNPYPYGLEPDNPYQGDFRDQQGNLVGHYTIKVGLSDPSSTIATADIIGWTFKDTSDKKKIRVRFRRPAWSDYAVLTNAYSHFDANWNIKGKVMSNTGVHFDGVANNVVSAGLSSYYDPDTGATEPGVWTSWLNAFNTNQNLPVFGGGTAFPVTQKDFTGVAIDMNMMQSQAQQPNGTTINNCSSTGCYFSNQSLGRHIVLSSNGTFTITTVTSITNNSNSIKTENSSATYNIPGNGIIFVNGNVWVEGTINSKRVTLVAANMPANGTNANIYIGSNNLKYTNLSSEEVIGLIAQGNIEFSTNGPSDLVIDAALLAQNGGIVKKDYNPNCCGSGCEAQKNSLGIFGSVASNQSLVFTVTKACNNSKAVGFQSKQITYDNNLLNYPPPYFPTDATYAVDDWKQL
ncbi:MAG TPA: pilus assembly PilX N-terminal domain-containing protein [Patescibacteria group bacterium]